MVNILPKPMPLKWDQDSFVHVAIKLKLTPHFSVYLSVSNDVKCKAIGGSNSAC